MESVVRGRALAISLAATAVALGCAGSAAPTRPTDTAARSAVTADASVPERISIADVVDVGDAKQPRPYDDAVAASVVDNQRWWATLFPRLYGQPYTPLTGGVYAGYPNRARPIPGCAGTDTTTQETLASYVAFYCGDGDFLAYDDGAHSGLISISNAFGPTVVAMVISHEWAHAIQQRAGVFAQRPATVLTEQQADCFSGAWMARAARGESAVRGVDREVVHSALAAVAEVRDPVGTDPDDVDGHGLAFDRIGAFQVGFTAGPERCVRLIESPLPLVGNRVGPSTSAPNARAGCDRPEPSIPSTNDSPCSPSPSALGRSLNAHFSTLDPSLEPVSMVASMGPSCQGAVAFGEAVWACAPATVVYDPTKVDQAPDGDAAGQWWFAMAWAELWVRRSTPALTGEQRDIARICAIGRWLHDLTATDRRGATHGGLTVSPDDLDRTVDMLLAHTAGSSGASPIDAVKALRAGFYDDRCW